MSAAILANYLGLIWTQVVKGYYAENKIFVVVLLSSCKTNIEHLGKDDFIKLGTTIEKMNSATSTQYIGKTQDRVYLEYFGPGIFGSKTIVFWTEISNLPSDYQRLIKEGKSPWVPWMQKSQD